MQPNNAGAPSTGAEAKYRPEDGTMTALCVIGSRHSDETPEADVGLLCFDCFGRLRSSLLELPAIAGWLHVNLAAGGVGGEKVGGTREDPIPLRQDILDLIGPVAQNPTAAIERNGLWTGYDIDQLGETAFFDELRSWVTLVHEESGFPFPTCSTVTFDGYVIGEYADAHRAAEDCRHERWLRRRHEDPRRWRVGSAAARSAWPYYADVASLSGWLAQHLSWLAERPWVDELVSRISYLAQTAHRVAPWRAETKRDPEPCVCGVRAVWWHIAEGLTRCERGMGGCGRTQKVTEHQMNASLPETRRAAG